MARRPGFPGGRASGVAGRVVAAVGDAVLSLGAAKRADVERAHHAHEGEGLGGHVPASPR